MDKIEKVVPFGLLFEEAAPQPQSLIAHIYDEERDLSYTEDSQGHWIPYIEISGAIGTQTETKAQGEETDIDPGDDCVAVTANRDHCTTRRFLAGTETFTKVEKEDTDKD